MRDTVRQKVTELGERLVAGAAQALHPDAAAAALPVGMGEPVFRSTVPFSPTAHAAALVLICNSHEYLQATLDFLRNGLKLDSYDLVSIPGGVQWLALPDLLPKHNKVARWTAEFLIREHSLKRVIAIAHEHCSAYAEHGTLGTLAHLATGKTIVEHQIDQLRSAGRELAAPGRVSVELYYAAGDGDAVVFRPVSLEPERA